MYVIVKQGELGDQILMSTVYYETVEDAQKFLDEFTRMFGEHNYEVKKLIKF